MRIDLGFGHPYLEEPDDEAIQQIFSDAPEAVILIESEIPNNFIQALSGASSDFIVEYRDSTIQRHYRMEAVSLETTVTLFMLYRRGEGSWKNDFPWEDVTLEYEWETRRSNDYQIPSSQTPALGGVYLLKAGPYYKIGKSTDPNRRFDQIRLQLPYPVEVIHQITTEDISGIEHYWHIRFATKRANGEWFLLTDEDVLIFKSRTRM